MPCVTFKYGSTEAILNTYIVVLRRRVADNEVGASDDLERDSSLQDLSPMASDRPIGCEIRLDCTLASYIHTYTDTQK